MPIPDKLFLVTETEICPPRPTQSQFKMIFHVELRFVVKASFKSKKTGGTPTYGLYRYV